MSRKLKPSPVLVFNYLSKDALSRICGSRAVIPYTPKSIVAYQARQLKIPLDVAYTSLLMTRGSIYTAKMFTREFSKVSRLFPCMVYDITYQWELDTIRQTVPLISCQVKEYDTMIDGWEYEISEKDIDMFLDIYKVEKIE